MYSCGLFWSFFSFLFLKHSLFFLMTSIVVALVVVVVVVVAD